MILSLSLSVWTDSIVVLSCLVSVEQYLPKLDSTFVGLSQFFEQTSHLIILYMTSFTVRNSLQRAWKNKYVNVISRIFSFSSPFSFFFLSSFLFLELRFLFLPDKTKTSIKTNTGRSLPLLLLLASQLTSLTYNSSALSVSFFLSPSAKDKATKILKKKRRIKVRNENEIERAPGFFFLLFFLYFSFL